MIILETSIPLLTLTQASPTAFIVFVGRFSCEPMLLRMLPGFGRYFTEGIMDWPKPTTPWRLKSRHRHVPLSTMTVFDNMAFGLKLRKYPKEEIKTAINDAWREYGKQLVLRP